MIHARTDPGRVTDTLDAVVERLRSLPREPLEEKELRKYRNFCKDKLVARLDSLQSRVRSLAEDERYFKRLVELDAEFAGLDAVTVDGLQQLASNWITPYRLSLAVLGNLKGVNIRPDALRW